MNDLLIRGATVHDGTGAPGRVADIAVKDARFAPPGPARATLDAGGLALMPGIAPCPSPLRESMVRHLSVVERMDLEALLGGTRR